MTIRAIHFDLYGTLALYGDMHAAWSDWFAAFQGGLDAAGHAVDEEALKAELDGFVYQPLPPDCGRGRTLLERRMLHACERLGAPLTEAQAAETADAVVHAWHGHITLDPSAHEVLEGLAATRRLALVSNFDHGLHVHRALDGWDLTRHFEAVAVSSEVGYAKPDPRIFDGVLASMALAPEEVCYVGDEATDVAAATAAGMRPVRIVREGVGTSNTHRGHAVGRAPEADAPDAVDTIADLRDLLSLA